MDEQRQQRSVVVLPDLAHARDLGRRLAEEGAGAGEALRTLAGGARSAHGRAPTVDEAVALVEEWAEVTLGHLHRVSCEDPLTGLATLAHLRLRVAELRRGGVDPARDRALVLVSPGGGHEPLLTELVAAALGERVRVVFSADEVVARTARGRVVVLAAADARLERLAALLRRLLDDDGLDARVAVLPLPEDELGLVLLLDRLDTVEQEG